MNIQEKKIENAILFFANKLADQCIHRMQLMKLLWFSDRVHLNKYGRLILNDRYKALPNGPIASKALDMSKHSIEGSYNVNRHVIKALKGFDNDFFSKSDLEIMDYVWEKFKDYDSWKLRDLSHYFPEWKRYEKELNDKNAPNSYDMVIQDFFCPSDKIDFSDILNDEIIQTSQEHFNINHSIQSALKS